MQRNSKVSRNNLNVRESLLVSENVKTTSGLEPPPFPLVTLCSVSVQRRRLASAQEPNHYTRHVYHHARYHHERYEPYACHGYDYRWPAIGIGFGYAILTDTTMAAGGVIVTPTATDFVAASAIPATARPSPPQALGIWRLSDRVGPIRT